MKLNRPNRDINVSLVNRLYIFSIRFESGMEVVKIGKSSGKSSLDRMLQIQRDYFNKYRCTFICRIVRDRECEDVFKYETELHRFFEKYQYKAKIPFDGSTELFCISDLVAREAYDYLTKEGLGALSDFVYDPEVYKEEVDELPF